MIETSGMKTFLALVSLILVLSAEQAAARGQADHVVVVVWDGMRPDFVNPQYTPALYELARNGTFFRNNHSAFITSTEVNGTALATGMHPDHSGIMANTAYRPEVNWLGSYGTESLDVVRRGDLATQGNYLGVPTVAELLHQAGFPTVIAGAKPIALLHDRAPKKLSQAEKDSVTLFRGQTLPRSVLDLLVRTREVGPFPTNTFGEGGGFGRRGGGGGSTNAAETLNGGGVAGFGGGFGRGGSANNPDAWTTKALVNGLWRKGVPKYSLLWLSEPDAAQHASGVGSDSAVSALARSDHNLSVVLQGLEEKGVLESTDIFVVSDHGFSTIHRAPDLVEALKRSKFTASTQFQNPEAGDIMVVNLGGSTSFYVFEHDEGVIRRLIKFLQGTDVAGVIFSALPEEGTFPLCQVHIGTTNGAPDVLVSMRWTDGLNDYGAPGLITSPGGRTGAGTHASLSKFDLHNTLIASGPDFKKDYVSDVASGNIDVAPTVLWLLGVKAPAMDGRVLLEALISQAETPPKPEQKTVEASRDLGFLQWRQYLKLTQVGSSVYYDEGNGGCSLK